MLAEVSTPLTGRISTVSLATSRMPMATSNVEMFRDLSLERRELDLGILAMIAFCL